MVSLLTAIENSMGKKLHEKNIEIENINHKNKELMEKIKQVAADALINTLKINLQQALLQGVVQMKEGFGESDIDDTASYMHPTNFLGAPNVPPKKTLVKNGNMICRVCNMKEISFLLMPCRNLFLCNDCEEMVFSCPECQLRILVSRCTCPRYKSYEL